MTDVKRCAIVYGMAKDQPRIGRKLRRAMEQARLNQNQVADALGVSRGAVNAWMNDRAYPQNSIGALEELLGVSFDDDEQPQAMETLHEKLDRLQRELDLVREQFRESRGNGDETNGGRRAG